MKTLSKFIMGASLALFPFLVFGDASIGDVADNLLGPTSIVTKLVEIACYIIGLAFILVSIAQYKIHRQSPKLVPLTTPIILFVLGFVALGIPYSTKLTKTGRTDTTQEEINTIPVPENYQQGTNIPNPPVSPNDQQSPNVPTPDTSAPPADSGSGGSGHWTDDPKYR